ncbi:hypothetical protein CC77DRAFT_726341 [Alternaria alternata]|uniref:Uncharacterized protein n=1 Tax=Alternaria alternata TaxID=5599 RepID=A0A177DU58_ALTAL|nr:hypothetical protein CC77DRAFT_726341 [Alternaria alternata]OAG22339.1 hypothetical protein CC77DRAFT_726341 [Alternaria alternata]
MSLMSAFIHSAQLALIRFPITTTCFTDILHFYLVIVCVHVSFQTKMYARPPLCSALTTTGVNVACTSVSLLSNSHVSPPVLVYCSASAHAKQKKAAQTPCLREVRQQNHEWTKITRQARGENPGLPSQAPHSHAIHRFSTPILQRKGKARRR